jgi:hypothetical protein
MVLFNLILGLASVRFPKKSLPTSIQFASCLLIPQDVFKGYLHVHSTEYSLTVSPAYDNTFQRIRTKENASTHCRRETKNCKLQLSASTNLRLVREAVKPRLFHNTREQKAHHEARSRGSDGPFAFHHRHFKLEKHKARELGNSFRES